LEKEKNI